MKFKAIFNQEGGTFKTTDMDAFTTHVTESFARAGHEVDCALVSGADLIGSLERAASNGSVEALLVGGGDGSISAAAGVAWKAKLPLGVVPAGTMNLFARSLKLPLDVHQAIDALAQGQVREVDIATANGRPFVHQFAAGLHARMVRLRDEREFSSRLGKLLASVRAAVGMILRPSRFRVLVDLDQDGQVEQRQLSAISISNNPFGNNPLSFVDDVTTGKLGIYLTDPLRPAGVVKLVLDILRGRLSENEAVTTATARSVRLHFPHRHRDCLCLIDGELIEMPREVEIRQYPGALRVLTPAEAGP